MRDEPHRTRNLVTQRPVSCDDERQAVGCGDELAYALLGRQSARIEDLRRIRLLADGCRQVNSARDDAHVVRAQPSSLLRER